MTPSFPPTDGRAFTKRARLIEEFLLQIKYKSCLREPFKRASGDGREEPFHHLQSVVFVWSNGKGCAMCSYDDNCGG